MKNSILGYIYHQITWGETCILQIKRHTQISIEIGFSSESLKKNELLSLFDFLINDVITARDVIDARSIASTLPRLMQCWYKQYYTIGLTTIRYFGIIP